MEKRGIRFLEILAEGAYIVSVPKGIKTRDLPSGSLRRLSPAGKVSSYLQGEKRDRALTVLVEFHRDVEPGDARGTVWSSGLQVVENPDLLPNHLMVRGLRVALDRLASRDEVSHILPAALELQQRTPAFACQSGFSAESVVSNLVSAFGEGWDGPGKNPATVGYFVESLPVRLPQQVQSEIERAMGAWSGVVQVDFRRLGAARQATSLDISFFTGDHSDGAPFDGPGRVLAHTYYPPPNPDPFAGDMHFDLDENWQFGTDVDVFSVALHELGHALGLVHSDDPSSVMYPYYRRYTDLQASDIANVQSLYASRQGAVPITVTTAPPGLAVVIDGGSSVVTPVTLQWQAGSIHTVSVSSTVNTSSEIRHRFLSWSDGGAASHSITTPSVATTFTATFQTSYRLSTTAFPTLGGSIVVTPTSLDGFYAQGSTVSLRAVPTGIFRFTAFSGTTTGTTNPVGIQLRQPATVVATFSNSTVDPLPNTGHLWRPGVFRSGLWFADTNGSNAWESTDQWYLFGMEADRHVLGFWNPAARAGLRKQIGVFRNGSWFVDYSGDNAWGAGDAHYSFGMAGDIPVVGDWDGSGQDKIGVFRNGIWYLDYNGSKVWDAGDRWYVFGMAGDIPVVNKWDGGGADKIGVFRNGFWFTDYNGNFTWDAEDVRYLFGNAGDRPILGDWAASGESRLKLGVFRQGVWFLDLNGTNLWDGYPVDSYFCHGLAGDEPVPNAWNLLNSGTEAVRPLAIPGESELISGAGSTGNPLPDVLADPQVRHRLEVLSSAMETIVAESPDFRPSKRKMDQEMQAIARREKVRRSNEKDRQSEYFQRISLALAGNALM